MAKSFGRTINLQGILVLSLAFDVIKSYEKPRICKQYIMKLVCRKKWRVLTFYIKEKRDNLSKQDLICFTVQYHAVLIVEACSIVTGLDGNASKLYSFSSGFLCQFWVFCDSI